MTEKLYTLRTELQSVANDEKSKQMKAYMKGNFDFMGIQSSPRRQVYNKFRPGLEIQYESELIEWVFLLWDQPEREFQLIAIDELDRSRKILTEFGIEEVEKLIVMKSWWDTVDLIASKILGGFYKVNNLKLERKIKTWSLHDNMWLNRTGILVQLKFKENTNLDLLKMAILPHIESNEFFHQKAIGWALRELSKTDSFRDWVIEFTQKNKLKPLSVREALKFI